MASRYLAPGAALGHRSAAGGLGAGARGRVRSLTFRVRPLSLLTKTASRSSQRAVLPLEPHCYRRVEISSTAPRPCPGVGCAAKRETSFASRPLGEFAGSWRNDGRTWTQPLGEAHDPDCPMRSAGRAAPYGSRDPRAHSAGPDRASPSYPQTGPCRVPAGGSRASRPGTPLPRDTTRHAGASRRRRRLGAHGPPGPSPPRESRSAGWLAAGRSEASVATGRAEPPSSFSALQAVDHPRARIASIPAGAVRIRSELAGFRSVAQAALHPYRARRSVSRRCGSLSLPQGRAVRCEPVGAQAPRIPGIPRVAGNSATGREARAVKTRAAMSQLSG